MAMSENRGLSDIASVERVTHGRLAQSNAAPGAGDTAFLHHRVEHDQEIEIEGSSIHSKHVRARKNAIQARDR